ncbi:MAG: DUF2235 domain-containing protein [Blastocatellia bacterium]|nr:DUF2235 domain-containing protein [Blastocatellia bacterium]
MNADRNNPGVSDTWRAKNIILLSDGTGNSAHDPFKTNVWRLYQALDVNRFEARVADGGEDPDQPDQIACYDDGVGTSSFQPLALLGGAFGHGLKRNVLDLYTYLCRNYRSADENANGEPDRIYLFGFSRGAFTVRVLADLIAEQGLIPMMLNGQPTSEADLQRLARAVFRANRMKYGKKHKVMNLVRNWLRHVRDGAIRHWDDLRGRVKYAEIKVKAMPEIAFVGVFDTVAAYGLPVDELTRAWDFVFPLSFPDQNLSEKVKRACHALALDDERHSFHPELWNEDENEYPTPGTAAPPGKRSGDDLHERLLQVWFAGMHSDVGGSYPDDAMSFVPLEWMLRLAADAGLRFKKRDAEAISAAANLRGPIHDSRRGVSGLYRYRPRKLADLLHDCDARVKISRPIIHESVFERIRQGTDGYAPIVLPAEYAVYTREGVIRKQGTSDPQWDAGCWQSKSLAETGTYRPVKPAGALSENVEEARTRLGRQEHIWNLVWKKRVVYFATVATAIVLALFPFYKPATAACQGPACFAAPVLRGVAFVLPGIASPLLKAYESHPGTFLPLLCAFIGLLAWGKGLQRRIFDGMRAIWVGKPLPEHERKPEGGIYWLRAAKWYQCLVWANRSYLLPWGAGLLAVWVIMGGVSHFAFTVVESAGCVCPRATAGEAKLQAVTQEYDGRVSAAQRQYDEELARDQLVRLQAPATANPAPTPLVLPALPATFDGRALCWPSGYWMEKGKRYRLILTARGEWRDASIVPPTMEGFETSDMVVKWDQEPFLYWAFWWRRHLGQKWFKPIARIGDTGHDEYPLDPLASSVKDSLVAELTARRDGELYLFLNDAALPLPATWQKYYRNNVAAADVRIQRLDAAGKPAGSGATVR